MKRLFTLLASASLLSMIGCAGDGPTTAEVQEQLRRGVSGEGQVTDQIDRTGDPYVKPREGAALSRE